MAKERRVLTDPDGITHHYGYEMAQLLEMRCRAYFKKHTVRRPEAESDGPPVNCLACIPEVS